MAGSTTSRYVTRLRRRARALLFVYLAAGFMLAASEHPVPFVRGSVAVADVGQVSDLPSPCRAGILRGQVGNLPHVAIFKQAGFWSTPKRQRALAALRLLPFGPGDEIVLPAAAALVIALIVSWWSRERRLRLQRERLSKTFKLGEEVLGSSSAESILERLRESLPGILGISRVQLYVLNRASKTLDPIAAEDREAASISLSSPADGTQSGAVACLHYRTPLVIPDIDRSPFPVEGARDVPAKSLLFVPMFAQSEVIGVLELDQDDRIRDFTVDEQELAQHLGNQTGVAIRLLDQRSVQEQLFRTEKLAAVGRLISGVVNELQTPLSSISDLAGRALEKSHGTASERELSAIGAEARKATDIVARLVSFASAETEARPVPIGALFQNLVEFRERDWKASGIRVHDLTTREPVFVLGLQGQLEQVFLNLLVHVEQILAVSTRKIVTIRTSVLAKRLLVEISFTAPPGWRKLEETAAVLGVTRSVIAGHGGEVRLIEKSNADPVFEVELPVTVRERPAAVLAANGNKAGQSRQLTVLVIDPDEAAQRQMMGLLAARGHRVVPVNNSDTGLDLAQRGRFDGVFVSVHAPGLNWVELAERLQRRTGGFVLVSDGYNSDLSVDFEGEGRFVLPKPVQEGELDRILAGIESQGPARPGG